MNPYMKVVERLDEAEAIKVLQEMLHYNTVNPPGQEMALAQYVAEKLSQLGIESHTDDLADGRGNVIGVINGGNERQGLLFNGHLDVVPPGDISWIHDPFSGVIEDGKVFGRGASDMKGGFAAMVVAATLIARADIPLKGDLLIAGTAGEEVDSIGAFDFYAKGYLKNVGAAVIGEPSNLKLFSATKGALWIEVTTSGKTAHGSMPDCGNNAIIQMNALINQLNCYQFDYTPHDLLGGPTINIATIKGGVKTNVVPDVCTLSIDMRTVPGQEHQAIINDFEKIIDQLSESISGFQATFKVTNNRPPVETPVDSEFMMQGIKAADEALDVKLVPCGVNYYTDASVFVPKTGMPTILFGPGDEKMAHQPNEYVEIEKYLDAIKFYVALALEYLT